MGTSKKISAIKQFGEKLFKAETGATTYGGIGGVFGSQGLWQRLDHGFIADRACMWGGKAFKGSEMAIVSRTYLPEKEIFNPPAGLKSILLPGRFMGPNEPGLPIATTVVDATPAAEDFIALCTRIPADMLAFTINLEMAENGICIALPTRGQGCFPVVKFVKDPRDSFAAQISHF